MTNAITSPTNKPMCQRMSNETMCKTLITMVYDGVPTEELLRASGRSKSTIYRLFREHYATPNCAAHKKLLKKLRENDAKMAEAQRLNLVPVKPSFVIVTETGALMKHMDKILASGAEVFIPQFCVTKELVKLSRHNNLAEEALEEIMSNPSIFHKICQLNEKVFTVIPEGMKTRVTGIISLMCEMWTNNLKVKLFTTSQDVYEMALKQGLGSDVEVVLLEN